MRYLLIIPLWITNKVFKIFRKNKAPCAPKTKTEPKPTTSTSQARYEEYLWHKEHKEK